MLHFNSIIMLLFAFMNQYVQANNSFNELFSERIKYFETQSVTSGLNNFTCTPGPSSPECSYHGTCKKDGTECVCDEGYASTSNGLEKCDYTEIPTWKPFLMEFFLGIPGGGGYFYLGYNGLGAGQLCYFWVGMIFACVAVCCGLVSFWKNDADVSACPACGIMCFFILWILGFIAWQITALVMIGTASLLDSNGMPVEPF
jgi:hypothetical protein